MTAGTKVFLAVFTLLIAMLVVYYGVMSPGGGEEALPVEGSFTGTGEPDDGAGEETSMAAAKNAAEVDSAQLQTAAAGPTLSSTNDPMPVLGSVAAEERRPEDMRDMRDDSGGPLTGLHRPAEANPVPGNGTDATTQVVAAAATRDASRPEPPKYSEYVVRSGDTMSSIALDWFGDTNKWDLIAHANPFVDPHAMQLGATLRLPPRDAKRQGPVIPLASPGGTHVVRPGETLTSISEAWFGSTKRWRQIYDLNSKKIGRDPHALRVGMKLKIPVGGREAASTTNG